MRLKRALYSLAVWPVGRIAEGPLKGTKWTIFAGSRFIRGKFEPEKTKAIVEIADRISPGCFLDIGANAGWFCLLIAHKWGDRAKIFAFEPSPVTAKYLRRNLLINNIKHCKAFEFAVSDHEGSSMFDTTLGRGTQKIQETGDLRVETDTVDHMLATGRIDAPVLVKIDVEGHEMSVLRGAIGCFQGHRPYAVVAVHSDALHEEVSAYFRDLNYSETVISQGRGDTELVFEPRRS